jgi:diguanylate cyclase (GGDEF)-like protein
MQLKANSHQAVLRSFDDLAIVFATSWINVVSIVSIVGELLLFVIAGFWIWSLSKTVRQQSDSLKAHAEAGAAKDQRNAQVEQRRNQILDDINSSRPLPELIAEITELVAFNLNGAFCWCETEDGTQLGRKPQVLRLRTLRREIPARNGGPLGTLFAAFEPGIKPSEEENAALTAGARLATLAIETRGLYKDLVHRSEFDLLTDIYNRFSLERYLEEQIEKAREEESTFGLIYIDLDEFKQMNDRYGHRVGDLYLQEVSLRMKRQLRSGDVLARLGGDEFAALVPVARNQAAVEEIAQRLERSFDAPFAVESHVLRGSASLGVALYPDDGTTADGLLNAADAAMYVAKQTKQAAADTPGKLRKALFRPGE